MNGPPLQTTNRQERNSSKQNDYADFLTYDVQRKLPHPEEQNTPPR